MWTVSSSSFYLDSMRTNTEFYTMLSFPWRLAKSGRKRSNDGYCRSFWQENRSVERCHKFACASFAVEVSIQPKWAPAPNGLALGSQVDLRDTVDKFLEYLHFMGSSVRWYELMSSITSSVHYRRQKRRTIYRNIIWRYFHVVELNAGYGK